MQSSTDLSLIAGAVSAPSTLTFADLVRRSVPLLPSAWHCTSQVMHGGYVPAHPSTSRRSKRRLSLSAKATAACLVSFRGAARSNASSCCSHSHICLDRQGLGVQAPPAWRACSVAGRQYQLRVLGAQVCWARTPWHSAAGGSAVALHQPHTLLHCRLSSLCMCRGDCCNICACPLKMLTFCKGFDCSIRGQFAQPCRQKGQSVQSMGTNAGFSTQAIILSSSIQVDWDSMVLLPGTDLFGQRKLLQVTSLQETGRLAHR